MEKQTEGFDQDKRRLDKNSLLWVLLGIIIVSIASINLWSVFNKTPEPTPTVAYASVPDFNLTNQQGDSLGLSDMAGKIWVADFIFTYCPTICPAMTLEMARLQSEFATEPVYFVSFSVDPERDTPDVLFRYAAQYGADERRWSFLTGEKEHIYQLAQKGFKLAAGHPGTELLHSTRFVLIAPDGKIHGRYDSRSKAALARLRRDINTLLGK